MDFNGILASIRTNKLGFTAVVELAIMERVKEPNTKATTEALIPTSRFEPMVLFSQWVSNEYEVHCY